MIILGVVLVLLGLFASIGLLVTLGVVLIIVGLILNFVPMGSMPRRRYY